MRCLAVARFRLLTIIRTATPLFFVVLLPIIPGAVVVSVPEPQFRADADFWLPIQAQLAVIGWTLHAFALSGAALMSGKVKAAIDEASMNVVADLMDTAPIASGTRFWGETLGTFAAAAMIHLSCLPLLVAVAVLSPLPMTVFVAIESVVIAIFVLASAGAAWQRRAPFTKYSATRGARNVAVIVALVLIALVLTTRVAALRDSFFAFLGRASLRAWSDVMTTIENPTLLIVLLAAVYAGTIAYYYRSATRNRVLEN